MFVHMDIVGLIIYKERSKNTSFYVSNYVSRQECRIFFDLYKSKNKP